MDNTAIIGDTPTQDIGDAIAVPTETESHKSAALDTFLILYAIVSLLSGGRSRGDFTGSQYSYACMLSFHKEHLSYIYTSTVNR